MFFLFFLYILLAFSIKIGKWNFFFYVWRVFKRSLYYDVCYLLSLVSKKKYFLILYFSSLEHPNLVRLHGITVNPLRMVMEFVSGGDLYHVLHSSKELSFRLRLRIALDVAKGMRYLQNISPIIYRDLRSPNILVCFINWKFNLFFL